MYVSIIIPTFNRAHLLKRVIPSYNQKYVKEILLIDDCSTDNTYEIARQLKTKIPILKYFRLSKKGLQTGAKNYGISIAEGEYLYFGDDDSILKPKSIESLYERSKLFPDEIIAARHLYMKEGEILEKILEDKNSITFKSIEDIYDRKRLDLNLEIKFDKAIEVPFCTYCFLIPRSLISRTRFYEGFIATCFREETDFILQMKSRGVKIILEPEALSIDLPRSQASGGIYSTNQLKKHFGHIFNEFLFYNRNRKVLRDISDLNSNPYIRAMSMFLTKLKNLLQTC